MGSHIENETDYLGNLLLILGTVVLIDGIAHLSRKFATAILGTVMISGFPLLENIKIDLECKSICWRP